MKTGLMIAPLFLLEACGGSTIDRQANEARRRQADSRPTQPVPPAPTARQPVLDPKSSRAAEQLVRNFAGLLASRNFDEAYMLLGPQAPPRRQFIAPFDGYRDLSVKVGAAGFQEGAAGSVYVSVPLSISGRNRGGSLTRNADVVLRRVNDVPGSTEAQRHWHIQRLDWHG
jgi:hypothetical protein